MKINEKGFWENKSGVGHVYDAKLCNALVKLLNDKNIKNTVDFGCGLGDYIKSFMLSGIDCKAYDGNPNTPNLNQIESRDFKYNKEISISLRNFISNAFWFENTIMVFEKL